MIPTKQRRQPLAVVSNPERALRGVRAGSAVSTVSAGSAPRLRLQGWSLFWILAAPLLAHGNELAARGAVLSPDFHGLTTAAALPEPDYPLAARRRLHSAGIYLLGGLYGVTYVYAALNEPTVTYVLLGAAFVLAWSLRAAMWWRRYRGGSGSSRGPGCGARDRMPDVGPHSHRCSVGTPTQPDCLRCRCGLRSLLRYCVRACWFDVARAPVKASAPTSGQPGPSRRSDGAPLYRV
jgi:hypothetical protein